MKRNILTSLVFALITISLYAQDPNILWQRTIGGSGDEHVTIAIETTDGGFIVGGYSNSNISGEKTENSRGGKDYWVLKFDSSGNIEWQKTIGGDQDDRLADAKQTPDDGYILVGSSASNLSGDKTENSRGGADYWIIKLDATGNIIWQRTLGGDANDRANEVELTYDGNYLIGGTSNSSISGDRTVSNNGYPDAWILKLDESGNIIWQRGHQFLVNFFLGALKITNDGGYIIGGTSGSNESYSFMKLDANGNTIWEKYYGGDGWDAFTHLILTSDGGYMAIGFSDSDASGDKTDDSKGGPDYWILKLDANGAIEWQKTFCD